MIMKNYKTVLVPITDMFKAVDSMENICNIYYNNGYDLNNTLYNSKDNIYILTFKRNQNSTIKSE